MNFYSSIRARSTTSRGGSFSAADILRVWAKGQVVFGRDPAKVRKDACGAWIRFDEYGKTTDNGWEIDHIVAIANGGGDELSNLQPLQWQNNRAKSDGPLACPVVASA